MAASLPNAARSDIDYTVTIVPKNTPFKPIEVYIYGLICLTHPVEDFDHLFVTQTVRLVYFILFFQNLNTELFRIRVYAMGDLDLPDCSNVYPGVTLTYFTARSNLVT